MAMKVLLAFVAILALTVAEQIEEKCRLPPQTEESQIAEEQCRRDQVSNHCRNNCILEALNVDVNDGWIEPQDFMNKVFTEVNSESGIFLTSLAEQCVASGKRSEDTYDFPECSKAHFVVDCMNRLIANDCNE